MEAETMTDGMVTFTTKMKHEMVLHSVPSEYNVTTLSKEVTACRCEIESKII
jgi:hypothetical protein